MTPAPLPRGSRASRTPFDSSRAPLLGLEWATSGLRQTGWVLLPLRLFLGVTFVVASLQKLANPGFFDASSPTSVQRQMQMVAPTSPIGFLIRWSLHGGAAVGVMIALAELAVGVSTLVGLKSRLGAVAGAALALTFFLTVSWTTSPYYYGADIVFLFAWTPFVLVGSAGVLSLDSWIADRRLANPQSSERVSAGASEQLRERRAVVATAGASLLVAAMATLIGRLTGSSATAATTQLGSSKSGFTARHRPKQPPKHQPTQPNPTQPSPTAGQSAPPTQHPTGTRIGSAGQVPVGQAARFTDPASGQPAWLVRLARSKCVAFSAICTHAGCTVSFEGSTKEFVCPCHGGTYSARTGQVLGGPPPAPLRSIPAHIVNGELYVD